MKIKLMIIFVLMYTLTFASSMESLGDNNNNNQEVKEKVNYTEMISYLKNSDVSQNMVALGTIYANGVDTPDDIGQTVEPDPILAEKYFLKAIEMKDEKASSILGGLYFYNDNMKKLDQDGNKALFHLKNAFELGNPEVASILSDVLFRKNMYKEGVKVLLIGDEKGDSSSQFTLAISFKKGLRDDSGEYVIQKDDRVAEYYLNKSCLNENKTKKIHDLCYNNKDYIEMVNE